MSVFLLAADAELEAGFAAEAEDDERPPPRRASLVLEKAISNAAIRIWVRGAAFMNASLI